MEYRSRQFLGRRNLPPGHGSLRRQGLVEYTTTHYVGRLADGTRELAVVVTKNQPPTRTRFSPRPSLLSAHLQPSTIAVSTPDQQGLLYAERGVL